MDEGPVPAPLVPSNRMKWPKDTGSRLCSATDPKPLNRLVYLSGPSVPS